MEKQSYSATAQRRYDLDSLRVFAFGLLILYHIGMLYVENWGFHFKSAYTSSFLENIMLLVNPWRLALLWIVSGIASSYILDKLRWWEFLSTRSVRLLLPLAFGVWVIVPPQLFVEMSGNGDFNGTYLEFYRSFLDLKSPLFDGYRSGIWPHVDVNHLWYLRELWIFTLVLMIILPLAERLREQPLFQRVLLPFGSITVLFSIPLLLAALDLAVFPPLGSEGRRKALGLSFFLLGYFLANQHSVWEALRRWRNLAIGMALLTSTVYLAGYHLVWLQSGNESSALQEKSLILLDHFMRWTWLCALFGFAFEHLNRPRPWLSYLSSGVYSFYLVHQTLILLLAFYVGPMSLGPVLEPTVIIAATFSGCLIIYEIARRVPLLRPLFGLRRQDSVVGRPRSAAWGRRAGGVLVALIVLLTGFEILV